MFLGEALSLRADLIRSIQELDGRIVSNATTQEGDAPAEDPRELLEESAQLSDQLENLITAINQTNSATLLNEGKTVTAALARRDTLATRVRTLQNAIRAANPHTNRYSLSEIRNITHLDLKALQTQHDEYAKERRSLDAAIQAHNWSTQLQEV